MTSKIQKWCLKVRNGFSKDMLQDVGNKESRACDVTSQEDWKLHQG